MAASPSSVLTFGLGAWSDVNLLVTLGLGLEASAPLDTFAKRRSVLNLMQPWRSPISWPVSS